MKDGKQAIRYIGFECQPGGERRLNFSIDEAGAEHLLISFDIAAMFFAGDRRILIQEAAGICYSKLKDLLRNAPDLSARFVLTADDIVQYRQLPPPRYRTAKPSVVS